jgi:short-subunit dehydrogenase
MKDSNLELRYRNKASMRENRDGLIINIGSVLGRVTLPFFGIYGASKFAVEALTDSLRYEVSQLGVEVVVVQPSAYPTNFLMKALNMAPGIWPTSP